MTTFIFVRHGQSESNLAQIFTGQNNTELTPLGMRQAERTAEYLKDRHIDVIYSSDLSRSMHTAEPTAKMHGLEIIPNKAFREINAGDWEGLRYSDLLARYPESYGKWINDQGCAHPEGGESVREMARRVSEEVDRLRHLHQGRCVAIFSHATPIRAMACLLFGHPIEKLSEIPWAPNASVSVVEYEDDGSHRILQYGYVEHQGDLTTTIPKGLA